MYTSRTDFDVTHHTLGGKNSLGGPTEFARIYFHSLEYARTSAG